ncbi:very short patch repair endonuclease [Pseudoclavibacter sp. Z016]|uniref:very short patch repair endonuclease n=1 Tax=Pseudoclavibacter sp. Z016 TaxID=2080581 RepID=UPI0021582ABF|nr:very short patch repair endonuclease [Pseudoclavibacter sp. Z016]
MPGNKRRDTKPEPGVRLLLHAAGPRYRVDCPPSTSLRTHQDIGFTRRRIAVLINGCSWHSCPLHAVSPRSNAAYWGPKHPRNGERDQTTNLALGALAGECADSGSMKTPTESCGEY